jgi:glycolate oxidase FAD binding subunit
VNAPANTTELAAIVRDANRARMPLRIVGAGGWSGAGSPAARIAPAATPVSLGAMAGIVAYVPDDLTLTVGAGTTLAEVNAVTAAHHQWCPLLPWGDDAGTVGATFATATTGPCAAALGRPRDIALGVEFVDGTGAVARGGGRVVKNVAGFDLTRLMVGAFGTVGVITEVTVRLRARPPVDVTLCAAPARDDAEAASALAATLRRAAVAPIACEALGGDVAARLAHPAHTVLVRYAGNRALVEAGRATARAAASCTEVDAGVWTTYRALDPYPRRLDSEPFATSVARRLRERFDPARVLNPGVFGAEP